MSSKLLSLIAILSLSVFTISCDNLFCSKENSEILDKERVIKDYNSIILNSQETSLQITQSDNSKLVLNGTGNSLINMKTVVNNDCLEISDIDCENYHERIRINANMLDIEILELTSNSNIKANSLSVNDKLELENSGSGDITIEELSVDRLTVELSGSGSINVGNKSDADYIDMLLTSSGDINAYNYQVKKANIEVSGSGSCRIHATDELNVDISGSGNVYHQRKSYNKLRNYWKRKPN